MTSSIGQPAAHAIGAGSEVPTHIRRDFSTLPSLDLEFFFSRCDQLNPLNRLFFEQILIDLLLLLQPHRMPVHIARRHSTL